MAGLKTAIVEKRKISKIHDVASSSLMRMTEIQEWTVSANRLYYRELLPSGQ